MLCESTTVNHVPLRKTVRMPGVSERAVVEDGRAVKTRLKIGAYT
jgi:hypothetical protein